MRGFLIFAAVSFLLLFAFGYTPSRYHQQAECAKVSQADVLDAGVLASSDQGSVEANQKATKEYQDKRDFSTACSDLAAQWNVADITRRAFWIGLIGMGFLAMTLKYTRDASDAARETLNVAQDTLDAAEKNSRRSLRAYLGVQNVIIMGKASHPSNTNDTFIKFDIVNSGQTPAYDVTVTINAIGIKADGLRIEKLCEKGPVSCEGFAQIHKGIPAKAEYEGSGIEFEKMIREGRFVTPATVEIFITVRYFDTFSVALRDGAVKFTDTFPFAQHLPTVGSEMWPIQLTQNNKQIT